MPIKQSSWKDVRRSERRRKRNEPVRRSLASLERKVAKALTAKDAGRSRELAKDLQQALDKAAKRGIIKKNAASRTKSRLAKKLAALK